MTREEALSKVKGYLTDLFPLEEYGKVEEIIKALEQEPRWIPVLDKMRAEINGMYRVILKGTPKDDWVVRWNECLDEVLKLIDKYKAESEG